MIITTIMATTSMSIIGNNIVCRITATIIVVVIGTRTIMNGMTQHSNRINKVISSQTNRLTSTTTAMGIHSTQDKEQVKVQTRDRTNPLNLEQMKMNIILLTIHILAAVARSTVLIKWKKVQETDNLIALLGTIYSTSMHSLDVLQCNKYMEVIC